jgi:hypothetical protein
MYSRRICRAMVRLQTSSVPPHRLHFYLCSAQAFSRRKNRQLIISVTVEGISASPGMGGPLASAALQHITFVVEHRPSPADVRIWAAAAHLLPHMITVGRKAGAKIRPWVYPKCTV